MWHLMILMGCIRTADCSDADVGLPPGTARQRALLRASAAGAGRWVVECCQVLTGSEHMTRLVVGASWYQIIIIPKEIAPNHTESLE